MINYDSRKVYRTVPGIENVSRITISGDANLEWLVRWCAKKSPAATVIKLFTDVIVGVFATVIHLPWLPWAIPGSAKANGERLGVA
jgi:hypothetical protein